jgi:hypothetical protein
MWVADRECGYWKVQTIQEYLESIKYDFDAVIKGYIDVFTFEDEHFLTYEEVFGEK